MSIATQPAPLGPDLRAALIAMVRRRVPESEVEDIVQQALAEAIESPHAPQDAESLRRWIFGVAKNKVVDYHRRAGRETFDLPEIEGASAPHVEADLLRWAERHLPAGDENKKTLDWMLREGDGEKLESIAASEKLPPPRVRQRVSRLRRHFKEHWQREVAVLAALGVLVSAVVLLLRMKKDGPEPITHEVIDPRAEPTRRLALERCAKSEWKACLEGLDDARRLDPAGDGRPEVQRARRAASEALPAPPTENNTTPVPTTAPPVPSPSAAPTSSPVTPILSPTTEAPPTQTKAGPQKGPAPKSKESTLESVQGTGLTGSPAQKSPASEPPPSAIGNDTKEELTTADPPKSTNVAPNLGGAKPGGKSAPSKKLGKPSSPSK